MGTATEEDLISILDRENRPIELVDGFLVENVMGWIEAYLAGVILTHLNVFVMPRGLGVVLGSEGMYRLNPGLIRLPDVSFVPVDRFPDQRIPHVQICPHVPTLAVEVLSPGNTRKEMDRKLIDYFTAGVLLVWYVDPRTKTVRVHTSPETSILLDQTRTLDGGDVLPGFALRLAELFDDAIRERPTS